MAIAPVTSSPPRSGGLKFLLVPTFPLPDNFRPQLNMTRAAGTDDRVGRGDIGREDDQANRGWAGQVRVHSEDVEIGVIQNVEHFTAKLQFHPLIQLPDLGEGEVPVRERRPTKN